MIHLGKERILHWILPPCPSDGFLQRWCVLLGRSLLPAAPPPACYYHFINLYFLFLRLTLQLVLFDLKACFWDCITADCTCCRRAPSFKTSRHHWLLPAPQIPKKKVPVTFSWAPNLGFSRRPLQQRHCGSVCGHSNNSERRWRTKQLASVAGTSTLQHQDWFYVWEETANRSQTKRETKVHSQQWHFFFQNTDHFFSVASCLEDTPLF